MKKPGIPHKAAGCSFPVLALFFCVSVNPVFASDCEILDAWFFEKQQEVIVTDWFYGYPYMRLTTETYPCATVRMKNTFWQALKSKDIEISATFEDGSTSAKKPECGDTLLEPGAEISCSVCFESGSPISVLECRFR